MAGAIPNPSRHEENTLTTLRDTLHEQAMTNKWSRNVDTNTFRAQDTMEAIKEGFTTRIDTSLKLQKEGNKLDEDKNVGFLEGI